MASLWCEAIMPEPEMDCESFVLQTCKVWCSTNISLWWIQTLCLLNLIDIWWYLCVCLMYNTTTAKSRSISFRVSIRNDMLFYCCKICFLCLDPMTLNWTGAIRCCPKHLVPNRRRRSFPNASATIPASRRISTSTVPPSRPCTWVTGLWVHVPQRISEVWTLEIYRSHERYWMILILVGSTISFIIYIYTYIT